MTVKHHSAPHGPRLYSGHSARPALTRLAVLAAANPVVAATLLKNPVAAAASHPHYVIPLDAVDRAILVETSRTSADGVGVPGWSRLCC